MTFARAAGAFICAAYLAAGSAFSASLPSPQFNNVTAAKITVNGFDVAQAAALAFAASPLWNVPENTSDPVVTVTKHYAGLAGQTGSTAGAIERYWGSPNNTGANGANAGGGNGGLGRGIGIECSPVGTLDSTGKPYDPTNCSMSALALETRLRSDNSGNASAWGANITVRAEPGSSGGIFGIETDFVNNSGHAGGFGEWVGNDGLNDGVAAFFADGGYSTGRWQYGLSCKGARNSCVQSAGQEDAVIGDNGQHMWGEYWSGTYSKYVWQYLPPGQTNSFASLDPGGRLFALGGLETTADVLVGLHASPSATITSSGVVTGTGIVSTNDVTGRNTVTSGSTATPYAQMTSKYGIACINPTNSCVQSSDHSPAVIGDTGTHLWGAFWNGTYSKYVWQYTHDSTGATSIAYMDPGGSIYTIGGFATTLGVTTPVVNLTAQTVGSLPANCTAGSLSYASDGRKAGEASGAGSGVPVICTPLTKGGPNTWVPVTVGTASVAN